MATLPPLPPSITCTTKLWSAPKVATEHRTNLQLATSAVSTLARSPWGSKVSSVIAQIARCRDRPLRPLQLYEFVNVSLASDEQICNRTFHFPQKRLGAITATVFSSTSEENPNTVSADSRPNSTLDGETQDLKLNLNLPRRKLQISFTCNACGARSRRLINPHAYASGTIFVQCAGCEVYHKLVDNLGLIEEYDFREYTDGNKGGEADLHSSGVNGGEDKPSSSRERDDVASKE